MIDEFAVEIDKDQGVIIPETDKIFNADGSKSQNKNKLELFHTNAAIISFL